MLKIFRKNHLKQLTSILILLLYCSCSNKTNDEEKNSTQFFVNYEKYELENGLNVVFHEDKSDPIVAVAVQVHVGSSREKPGKTGFAHFFEHMFFKKSENVPEGYFMNEIIDWGGSRGGRTNLDRTQYFEVVPKNALEKVLWMEADRVGFFINSVSRKSFEIEKQVIKNEKRQRIDNVSYGHTNYVTIKALYPKNHPYNWSTIGELEDIQNATLEDLKEFYHKWYGPQNTTLVIAGDFDMEKTKYWIEKYFGEIKPREEVSKPTPMPITLDSSKLLYHEDDFARLPELTLNFPTVEQYHPDSWALDILSKLLSDGKSAPLYKKVVLDDKLAPNITTNNSSQELAGVFAIEAKARSGIDLNILKESIFKGLTDFEENGFSKKDLERVKTTMQANFFNTIPSIQEKAKLLAHYDSFLDEPGFIVADVEKINDVTLSDIKRVYEKYIKGKNYVATSFVPKGETKLVLEGSVMASVIDEPIKPYQPKVFSESDENYKKTASKIDRSIEPEFGPTPIVKSPKIWKEELKNKLSVYGIENYEQPMVTFSLKIKGGMLLENQEKIGITNLMTKVLLEGTKNKTPEELENAIKDLGADIFMYSSENHITIVANFLAKHYDKVLSLVEEIVLQPRWDYNEFKRIQRETITEIKKRTSSPPNIASLVRNKLLYKNHIRGNSPIGTEVSINNITIEDLKLFYKSNFAPNVSTFHIVGSISESKVLQSLGNFENKWFERKVSIPSEFEIKNVLNKKTKLFFVDIPGAKQSLINIARLTVSGESKTYLPIEISNYMLGPGGYGDLNQDLRVKKGYSYGAYSSTKRDHLGSQLYVNTFVRSNVTKESIEAARNVLHLYRKNYNLEYLERTKNALLKAEIRKYETRGDLLSILHNISTYNLPLDYLTLDQERITNISLNEVKGLVNEYINPEDMIYIIVGDKATQFDRLNELGLGKPILLDKNGDILSEYGSNKTVKEKTIANKT